MCKERLAERNERCTRTRTRRMCKERLAERNERCTRTRTRRMSTERLAERNERCTRTRTRRMCTERLAERNERCTRTCTRRMCRERLAERNERGRRGAGGGAEAAPAPRRPPHQPAVPGLTRTCHTNGRAAGPCGGRPRTAAGEGERRRAAAFLRPRAGCIAYGRSCAVESGVSSL